MVSTFTANKSLEQPANNDYIDTWDIPVNADWAAIDLAFGASVSVNLAGLSGDKVLVLAQYRPLKIVLTGNPAAAVNVVVPSPVGGLWIVRNNTSGGDAITFASGAGGPQVSVPAGTQVTVTCDGTATGMGYASTAPAIAGGSTTQVQFNDSGFLAGAAGLTWDGLTFGTTGLSVSGNTVLGNDITDTAEISGPLVVGGSVQSLSGGYIFPDGSVQTTAGTTAIVGAVIDYIGTVRPDGWVFANGQTIGNATSNASGRANADTVALFALIWNSWANAQAQLFNSVGTPVSRGASAAADFAVSRHIVVPDLRGRVVSGLDVLGSSGDAGRMNTLASTTPGADGGAQTHTLTTSQIPAHNHPVTDPGHNHAVTDPGHTHGGLATHASQGVQGSLEPTAMAPYDQLTTSSTTGVTINANTTGLTVNNTGGGTTHNNIQPTMFMSKIIKL